MVTEMDTKVLQQEKFARLVTHTFSISLIAGLLFTPKVFNGPPILAQGLTIAHGAIVSPIFDGAALENNISKELSVEQRTANFNNEIKNKYRGGTIVDIDKGVKHIKLVKYYSGRPVRINVVEINSDINSSLRVTPVLATEKMGRKSTITSIARNNKSIVAINGTYFKPSTGVPLGTLMINKKMYTGPIYNRVAMGIFDNHYDMARVQLNGELRTRNGIVKFDNINQPRMLSTHVIVYTPLWGKVSPVSPKYGKQVVVENDKVIKISANSQSIPKDGYVVVGPAKQIETIAKDKEVTMKVETIPQWDNVNHIIGGGPYLVKDGQIYVDTSAQKLNSIGGRNPRTAVGYTTDNNLIIVTVDGRENSSIGLTLPELANFMKSIGCFNAMNLDGGGSTVMYVKGRVVNHPQVKGGIALSNAIVLNKV
ncbi:phosphodiester glycosidase family protein [bacterium]|nr:phosphodiester glycosidase family protein [bacterium]